MSTKILSTILVTACFLSCSNDEDFTNQHATDQMQAVSEEQAYTILGNFLTKDNNGLFILKISAEGAAIYNINNATYNEAVRQIEALNFHLSRHPQYAPLHKTPFHINQQKKTRVTSHLLWNVKYSDDNVAEGTIGIPYGFDYPTKGPSAICRELYLYLFGKGTIRIGLKGGDKNLKNYDLSKQQRREIYIENNGEIIKGFYICNLAKDVKGEFFAYTKYGVIQTQ